MKDRYFAVSEDMLRNLLYAANIYHALDCGGVDNWSWYGESISDFKKSMGYEPEDDIETIVNDDIEQFTEIEQLQLKDGRFIYISPIL